MEHYFFYFLAGLALLSSLMVVVSRNPVTGAMFMIVAFMATAGLFVLLEAFLLAVLQVVVYAGAVMVLFLFIIMLLNVEASKRLRPSWLSMAAAVVALGLLTVGVGHLFITSGAIPDVGREALPAVASEADSEADPMAFGTAARAYGYGLFTKYMLPFQVTGFLLLIAMIGVIVLSRRVSPLGEVDASAKGKENV